ncbi:MAG: DUF3473 domain-containing protein, partial [Candidatus Angelobacter sp.]
VDPEQPRIHGSMKSRLRHYTNLGRMHAKLDSVLAGHKFQPFKDVLAAEAAEAMEQQVSPHTSGIVLDEHLNEPVQAVAQTSKGRE